MPAPMRLLDLTLPTLSENLALDEALLLEAEAGGQEVLRFWHWPPPLTPDPSPQKGDGIAPVPPIDFPKPFRRQGEGLAVVIGAGGRWREETRLDACQSDGVPILRRSSGGGAVLLGPGCLLFSLILAFDRDPLLADLHGSYRLILNNLANSLSALVPGIEPAGISDLAIAGRKVSGNAQQRKRTHLLHHGTLLCSIDLTPIPRYLAHPPREPDYRQRRSHVDFVANLDLPIAVAKHSLASAWQAVEPFPTWPHDRVRELCKEKYDRPDWHERR